MTKIEKIQKLYAAMSEVYDDPVCAVDDFPTIRANHLSIDELIELLNWMETFGTVTLHDDRSSYEGSYDNTYHLWVQVEPKGSYMIVAHIDFIFDGKRSDLVTYVEGRYPKTA